MLEILVVHCRSHARLRAEVLALRHQVRVLERQVGRPRWQPVMASLLAAISRALSRPAWRSLLPSPETLLRWHRELVRRKWAAYRRRPRRRRAVDKSQVGSAIALAACSTSTNEPPNEATRQRLTSHAEAHEVKETHPATAMYFIGFLTLIVIDVVS